MTQNNQKKAYSSLENLVSVGYNYYSQCYELKKKKQGELSVEKNRKPRLKRVESESIRELSQAVNNQMSGS